MAIEVAIVLLIWVAVIVAVAWVLVYIAGQAGAPQPVAIIIWAVAFLLVLLMLLRHVGVMRVAELALVLPTFA